MPNNLHSRKVTRVLVMLEYEPGDPDNGEVFDLTALVAEMYAKQRGSISNRITLDVCAGDDYSQKSPWPMRTDISWRCGYSASAGNLTDAINTGMPDGDRVQALSARVKKLRKKADSLEYDAKVAKLEQVAAIRSQHPIARVTATPLAEVTKPELTPPIL